MKRFKNPSFVFALVLSAVLCCAVALFGARLSSGKVGSPMAQAANDAEMSAQAATQDVTIKVNWSDNSNKDKIRPDKVSFNVVAIDATNPDAPVTITGKINVKGDATAASWTKTVSQLEDDEGNLTDIPAGAIVEVSQITGPIQGYKFSDVTVDKNGAFIVTNTVLGTFRVSGNVSWADQDDLSQLRPKSIVVELWREIPGADGTAKKVTEKTVRKGDVNEDSGLAWGYTFKGDSITPTNGTTAYKYYVKAGSTPKGYQKPEAVKGNEMFLRCAIRQDIKPVFVSIKWDDDSNSDGKRPDIATAAAKDLFTLTATAGTTPLTIASDVMSTLPTELEADNWMYTLVLEGDSFQGANVEYDVKMKTVDGYKATSGIKYGDGIPDAVATENSFPFTMKNAPQKINVAGTIAWNDSNNAVNARPQTGTLTLYKGTGASKTEVSSVEVNADNASATNASEWEYAFKNLPKYEKKGTEIKYSVEAFFSGLDPNYTEKQTGYDFTYSYPVTNVNGILEFDDSNDGEGLRESFGGSVTVQLGKKDAAGNVTMIDGARYKQVVPITNQKSQYLVTFAGVPAEDSDGNKIDYVLRPVFDESTMALPEGYEVILGDSADDPWRVTLKHVSTSTAFLGKIRWDDSSNANGLRLQNVTLGLYKENTVAEETSEVTRELIQQLTIVPPVAGEDSEPIDEWDYRFDPVPIADENGESITYVVDVIVPDEGLGSYTYARENDDFVFTFDPVMNDTDKDVYIDWKDDNDDNGDRPESVTVQLYTGDGDAKQVVGVPVTLTDNEDFSLAWKHVYETLPVYDEDKTRIDYRVEIVSMSPETASARYGMSVQDDGNGNTFAIDAAYSPELADISGTITWDDNDNNDKARPATALVRLVNDDGIVASMTVTPQDTAANQWTFTFEDMPVKLHGNDPHYRIDVADMPSTYDVSVTGMDATAQYDPLSTSRHVTLTWDGGTSRPDVNVRLTADGEGYGTIETLSPLLGWSHTWDGLPAFVDGKTIEYGLTVVDIPGYVTNVTTDGSGNFTVRLVANSASFQNVDGSTGMGISGSKYQLLDGDSIFAEWTSDGSAHKVEELVAGKTYTLHEVAAGTGYNVFSDQLVAIGVDGNIDPSKSTVHVEDGVVVIASNMGSGKHMGNVQWSLPADFPSLDRPFMVVELYCNDIATGKTLRTQDGSYAFLDLAQYDSAGNPLSYNVKAHVEAPTTAASTWTSADWFCTLNGDDVAVKYEPETTSIQGGIVWVGDTSADRPSSVTVNVMLNGRKSAQKAVLASDFWLYEIGDLPVRATNGITNEITVSQNSISNYSTAVRGYDITNTRTGDSSSIQPQLISNGIYYIESSVGSNKVLDISGGSIGDGANAQIWSKNDTNAQKFRVTYSASSNTYTIACVGSNKMLDIKSARYVNGTNIHQWAANGTNAQKFKIVRNIDGTYRIQSAGNANYVLDVNAGSNKNGANVHLWSYNGSKAQSWKFTKTTATPAPSAKVIANGTYTLYSKVGSSKALDISGGGKGNGANAQIWTANGTKAQKFALTYDNNGYYTIKNMNSGKMLDANAGGITNGTNVQQWASNGTDAQKWRISKNSDGSYTIMNKKSGKVLDVNGASNRDGANVHLWTSNGTNAQKWRIA